jgi:chorismate mutase
MSPQNKKKLNLIRKQLDKLDNNLLRIIEKRTNIVKNVLNIKEYKYEIVDKKRINKILSNIKKKSLKHKIDPNITKRIWKNMIWAYISFEKKNFKKK